MSSNFYLLLFLFKNILSIFDKPDTVNISMPINDNRKYLIDDYCNVDQSQITIRFFKEILEYFNSVENITEINNNKCLILDYKFNNYYSQFEKLKILNKDSFVYYTCPICQKDFKSNSLLNLHYKLFHMKYNESLICPGDFCLSINCNKYYDYFDIKKLSKNPQDVKFNRQPAEKDEKCVDELVFFYKTNCMKLIEGCFGDDKDKYYLYYKYICNEIKCGNDFESKLTKESNFSDIFRYICMYLFSILSIIYLILVWLTKYA